MTWGASQVQGARGNFADVDLADNAVVTISGPHHKVHQGRFFNLSKIFAAVANNASADVLMKTGATAPHMVFDVTAGGNAYIYLYEGTTVSADGTTLAVTNHSRASTRVADLTGFHTPTVSATGTQLDELFIPAGSGPKAGGGGVSFADEYILAVSTNYLIRITNKSGGAADFGVHVEFYEPEG